MCFAGWVRGQTARPASKALGRLGKERKALSDLIEVLPSTAARKRRSTVESGESLYSVLRERSARLLASSFFPALLVIAGCGGGIVNSASNGAFSITPGTATIDTNCTGCNAAGSGGAAVEDFSALAGGSAASVTWSVSGGDSNSGPGSISASGQYTPPPYLTSDSVHVTVTAASSTDSSSKATATLTVTPGFLQPLTPVNVSLGSGGNVTVTGYIAEAGGSDSARFAIAGSPNGTAGGQGTLGPTNCTRSSMAFTYCTVTYSAPTAITATGASYVVATVGASLSKESTEVLLNTAGITSNPATHQTQQSSAISLGTSGGNNNDYDTKGNQIVDCCGGTLGSLVQNSNGTQYILSCNHVLARSDQATVGESIVQPGLIDNNCTPNGEGPGTTPVGALTAWLPLSSSSTNADAAIAQVDSGAVNTNGEILELGAPSGGTLAAAPPGTSSTGGKGETASLNMSVAKSGRTTGLTCASIAAVNLNVEVSYFANCAETDPYITKTYTNQIAIEGEQFSDAGDSGSLVVDSSNAEPVGLFFAGGVTNIGGNQVSEGVANPASEVLSELSAQQGTTYSFVGTADHPVSCLNYGSASATAAQGTTLTAGRVTLAQSALLQARMLVNPSVGILGAATGKSSDHAGEAAIILYVDPNSKVGVPQIVDGVRTQVVPTTVQAMAEGAVPRAGAAEVFPPLTSNVLNQAITAKEEIAQSLMKQNPAFFGVGVGQSFDNPREAALVIYVDRKQLPSTLSPIINGLRARYIVMDRLHVTRSYLSGLAHAQSHCMPHSAVRTSNNFDLLRTRTLPGLNIY